MKRVYLDQNKWVDLLKARVGHPGGKPFADVYTLAAEAADRGWVSFPLSLYHLIESWNRRDYQSRQELAVTMARLSKWHAISPPPTLLKAEIDNALRDLFGRPAVPRRVQVFGVGIDHCFTERLGDYEAPAEVPLTPEQRRTLTDLANAIKQMAALVGPPPGFRAPGFDAYAHRQVSTKFAVEQEQLRAIRSPDGWHRGERGHRATSVDVFAEFDGSVSGALEMAGLHWGHLYDAGREGMDQFIESVPIMSIHRELRHLRHAASQKAWATGDLVDLAALGPAIAYCDVVVTENSWTDFARRAKLDERFGTTILRDLRDLVPILLDAPSG